MKNGKCITVAHPGGMPGVIFYPCTIEKNIDAVAFAGSLIQASASNLSNLKVVEAYSTKARRKATLELQYTGKTKELMKSRYYITVDDSNALVMEFNTFARNFKAQKPLLLSILSKIKLRSPPAANAAPPRPKPDLANNPDAPFLFEMVQYSSSDGSCRMTIPRGWNVAAQRGTLMVTSPDGGAGFAFSTADFIGQGNVPYLDSSKLPGLHYNYRSPVEAMALVLQLFGATGISSTARYPNNAQASTMSTYLRRSAESEYAMLTYTDKKGKDCKGFFDVTNLKPLYSGKWGTMYEGVWAPRSQFNRYLLTLVDMWESFSINEGWSDAYIRQGVANLKRLGAETIAKSRQYAEEIRQGNLATFNEKMKSGDYIDYKRSTMIRGQQDWVNGLEGGSVYTSDSDGLKRDGRRVIEGQGANYNNFNGQKYDLVPLDVNREFFDAHRK